MPYKDPITRAAYQKEYYKLWYERNGNTRNRAVDYQEAIIEWQKAHPEAMKTRKKVWRAVRNGKLIKPNKCTQCKRVTKLSGHHDDYSKPLELLWLCSSCHKLKHSIP